MTDPMRGRVIAAVSDVYGVDAEIGRGGMAIVYRATDLRLHRRVAIKVLPPELAFREDVRRRFLREAETAAQLNHPNIVPIYSVDERDGLVYFVMALIEGESLGARLARGPLPVSEARRILRDVADALAYAHAHGVVHRDIKPDNILLERDTGRPMVTDFGIARAAEADSRLTATGIAVGTPAYMSPEQALGDREVDGRSDIYSLGVVAYQLLTGDLPFKATNTPSMMMKHINETPRPLGELRADVPPGLAATVDRALAKRPEQRWPTAGAFRDALMNDRVTAPAEGWQHPAVNAPPSSPRPSAPATLAPQPSAPPPAPPVPPQFPGPPYPYMSRREWKQYYRNQRYANRERLANRPIEERITIFRRNLVSTGVVVTMLAGINLITTPQFPWFLFAALGMGAGVMRQWSNLWAEGVGWRRIFQRGKAPEQLPAPGAAAPQSAVQEAAAKMVPRDVLDGPHGGAVRRAAADRLAILSIVESLSKADRALLPDVVPTVHALAERAASLAQMLHHLDADVSPETLTQLEARIAQVKGESEDAADRERRLSLLERQYASLQQLVARRTRLFGQLESAGIALQNLKFDLLKLRSSGMQAALNEVTSATVEARALSRDIGHVLDAAEEVRKL